MDELVRNAIALRREHRLGWEPLSQALGMLVKRLQRWSARVSMSQPRLMRRGPRKQGPPPPTLAQEIRDLRHGAKRSRGVGELQRRHETVISRRVLVALVRQERRAILDWLRIRQCKIIQSMKDAGPRLVRRGGAQAKSWRQAVEEWLVSHDHIRIHNPTNKNQKVLPYFHDFLAQN